VKKEAASYTETSVTAYNTTRYHNSENIHRHEHLISHYLCTFKTQTIYRRLSCILLLILVYFKGYTCFKIKHPVHGVHRAGLGRSLLGIAGSNPSTSMDICLLWMLFFFQVELSASGWSLVQRSPTECVVSECGHEASTMGGSWPTGEGGVMGEKWCR